MNHRSRKKRIAIAVVGIAVIAAMVVTMVLSAVLV